MRWASLKALIRHITQYTCGKARDHMTENGESSIPLYDFTFEGLASFYFEGCCVAKN